MEFRSIVEDLNFSWFQALSKEGFEFSYVPGLFDVFWKIFPLVDCFYKEGFFKGG